MAIVRTESADPANLPMAKEIAEILTAAYPNHSWYVRIDGGLVIIKNLAISVTASMVRHLTALDHDATARKRDVIMAAGEFLEAAHMRRGAYEGEAARVLEGLNGKFKPLLHAPGVIHGVNRGVNRKVH
jgi:hypothetical protein